ncbi:hypothetical protein LX36DRAFT_665031 [Colletotrichum falcatum]|nr:hypothetical protein LX36DRAFT_665031 [Colletotrichum falcatum]
MSLSLSLSLSLCVCVYMFLPATTGAFSSTQVVALFSSGNERFHARSLPGNVLSSFASRV